MTGSFPLRLRQLAESSLFLRGNIPNALKSMLRTALEGFEKDLCAPRLLDLSAAYRGQGEKIEREVKGRQAIKQPKDRGADLERPLF